MKKIAVIGANGFVGSALCRQAREKFELTKVTRQNYEDCRVKEYDIVINAAMPSKRFWAFQNPLLDVKETIVKTSNIFYGWNYNKFVQIIN
jgi:nucleoside-diphosphate-sugar epimerase